MTDSAFERFYNAILAYHAGDTVQALALTEKAQAAAPHDRVYAHAVKYLRRAQAEGRDKVYVEGNAFSAFIRGGGNVPMYEQVSRMLSEVYREYPNGLRLLDIGVGDGLALVPALSDEVTYLTLVEPSENLLAATKVQLDARQVRYDAHALRVQDYLATSDAQFDIAQATLSLQSLPPEERRKVLAQLRDHTETLLVAEFDVPLFESDLARERVAYVVTMYRDGLAEYAGDEVAQGFLMPILFGYFDPDKGRENWEAPLDQWVEDIESAGFETPHTELIYNYWWAPAFLLHAKRKA